MRSRDNPTCIRTRALHVHEVGVGRLHKPLELVAALLVLGRGVEEVDGERLKGVVCVCEVATEEAQRMSVHQDFGTLQEGRRTILIRVEES